MHIVIKHELLRLKEDNLSRKSLFKEISAFQIYKGVFNTIFKGKFSEFNEEYTNLTILYEKISKYLDNLANSDFLQKKFNQYVVSISSYSTNLESKVKNNSLHPKCTHFIKKTVKNTYF